MSDQLRLSTPNATESADDQRAEAMAKADAKQRKTPNKIGARKNSNFIAISTLPSVNKTPIGSATPPIPYPTSQDLSNSVSTTATVKFNRDPALVLNQSKQPKGKGDAPGAAKGIKSNTVTGEVKPTKGSGTVRAQGKPIVRQDDTNTMNGGNNPGIYTTKQKSSAGKANQSNQNATPESKAEKGFMQQAFDGAKSAAKQYQEGISASLHDFAGQAMETGGTIAAAGGGTAAVGGAMVATGIGAVPGAVLVTGGGATAAVGGGVSAVGGMAESAATGLDAAASMLTSGQLPNVKALAMKYAERMVMSKVDKLSTLIPSNKRTKKSNSNKGTSSQPPGDGVNIVGNSGNNDCGIKAYKDQKCPKGQQAHHIVPDYTLRYGNRSDGEMGLNRIPGMPSLDDGPSICLSGGSKVKGSDHNLAHEGTDPQIAAAGNRTDNGPIGAAPIGELIDISIEEVGKVKPHCKEEIKKKVDDAFKGVDRNKHGRTTQPLPKGDALAEFSQSNQKVESQDQRTKTRKKK